MTALDLAAIEARAGSVAVAAKDLGDAKHVECECYHCAADRAHWDACADSAADAPALVARVRELEAETARLRAHWVSLAEQVEHELHRRRNPGGQQVGPSALGGVSVGALHELARECRAALEGGAP